MNRKIFSLFTAALLLLLGSCSRGSEQREADDSGRLYSATMKLIAAFADTISEAPDSAAAIAAYARFHTRLDSINQSVAPNTDMLLTEGQNDTIFIGLMGLMDLYDTRLESLARSHEDVDTDMESELWNGQEIVPGMGTESMELQ